jgi:hypothetical protein
MIEISDKPAQQANNGKPDHQDGPASFHGPGLCFGEGPTAMRLFLKYPKSLCGHLLAHPD